MGKKVFSFHKNYFAAAAVLFLVETFIAIFIKDKFIRPYFGDFLVVILIYCFLKSFWNGTPLRTGIYVLVFSFAIEAGQYFGLVKLLGLGHSAVARTVIGTGFDWGDLAAYTLGILAVLGFEKFALKRSLQKRRQEGY